ncbi:hypothetical protein [Pseudoramibacter alactolyticus]|nr:hypothetical protein [Pseudoramibacter alactolyticus]
MKTTIIKAEIGEDAAKKCLKRHDDEKMCERKRPKQMLKALAA